MIPKEDRRQHLHVAGVRKVTAAMQPNDFNALEKTASTCLFCVQNDTSHAAKLFQCIGEGCIYMFVLCAE